MKSPTATVATLALFAAAGTVALVGAPAQRGGGGYPYQSGKELYEHICQGCHMPDGKGASGAGAYPALAGDKRLQSSLYPAIVILRGQKAMTPFPELTDAQIAEVSNYVRSSFGNQFPGKVTADQVKALRPKPKAGAGFRAG